MKLAQMHDPCSIEPASSVNTEGQFMPPASDAAHGVPFHGPAPAGDRWLP